MLAERQGVDGIPEEPTAKILNLLCKVCLSGISAVTLSTDRLQQVKEDRLYIIQDFTYALLCKPLHNIAFTTASRNTL